MVLGAGDDPRLVERRQAHGLRFVELRILKRGDAKQAVPETGEQPLLGDIELIAVDDFQRRRQRSDDRRIFAVTRGRCRPRLIVDIFWWKQPHTQNPAAPFRVLRDLLNVGAAHPGHTREKRPLIGPWRERVIEEHAVALLPCSLLQGQGNQVAEPALRHGVLVGKQAVVRVQPDIGPALHGLGQEVRPKPTSQAGSNRTVEEDPDVSAVTRARPLERRGHTQAPTGLEECLGIVPPADLVEIDGQEVAGLVSQQRVHTRHEGLAVAIRSGQMPRDDLIGDREQATLVAV